MIETKNSNYSIFLLSLLFIEFISNFLRANSLPNLGIYFRMLVFSFIIMNFIICLASDIFTGKGVSKICVRAILFWLYSVIVYFISLKNITFVNTVNLTTWVAVLYLFNYYGFPRSIKLLNGIVGTFSLAFFALYYKYALHNGFVGNKPGVINSIYYLALIIPFILLFKSKPLKILFIVSILLLSFQSDKTTAIIIVLFSILICLTLSAGAKKKNILTFAAGILAFILLLLLFTRFTGMNLNDIVSSDIESGGNGRFDIWRSIFINYKNGSLIQKLFGFGFGFAVEVTGNSAHCDFFEIITAFGILGFLIFVSWFVAAGKRIIVNMSNQRYFYIAVVSFTQMLIIFMFSTSIFVSNYFLLLCAFIGMLFNYYESSENDLIKEVEAK